MRLRSSPASRFSGGIASPTRTVARLANTCSQPSAWAQRRTSPSGMCSRSSVGSSRASTGTWLARMPISPTDVLVESCSTSPVKTSPSGVRRRTSTVCSAIAAITAPPPPLRVRGLRESLSGLVLRLLAVFPVLGALVLLRLLLGGLGLSGFCRLLGAHLLGRVDHLVDRALHVEGPLGNVVELAIDDLLEAADRLGDRHVLTTPPRELLGHEERLGEEALDLARP